MRDFVWFMQPDYQGEVKTSARISLQSHLMAFAAEKSRIEGVTIRLDEYIREVVHTCSFLAQVKKAPLRGSLMVKK